MDLTLGYCGDEMRRGPSRKFLNRLEEMTRDRSYSPQEQIEAAALLVRMYTTAVPVKKEAKSQRENQDSLAELLTEAHEETEDELDTLDSVD